MKRKDKERNKKKSLRHIEALITTSPESKKNLDKTSSTTP
jgi:hypothetical protein